MGRDDFLLSFFFRSTYSLSRSEDGREISLVGIERELLKSVIMSFILYDCRLLRGILYPFGRPGIVWFGPSCCDSLHIMLDAKPSRLIYPGAHKVTRWLPVRRYIRTCVGSQPTLVRLVPCRGCCHFHMVLSTLLLQVCCRLLRCSLVLEEPHTLALPV